MEFVHDQPGFARQIVNGVIPFRRPGDSLKLLANQARDALEEREGPVQRPSQSTEDALPAPESAAQQFLGSDSRARRPVLDLECIARC
ncbi:hypothetical protein BCEN4_590062 [Burkholderia cenocepacia]|nr:hypothetical protein BCEN4_590062 [Burkholderia cenocepacia]